MAPPDATARLRRALEGALFGGIVLELASLSLYEGMPVWLARPLPTTGFFLGVVLGALMGWAAPFRRSGSPPGA